MSSETSKARHLVAHYCCGNGADVGSGGDPVVPHAIQIELSDEKFAWYNSGHVSITPLQFRGDEAYRNLPFRNATLDFVFSSHLLEDFLEWEPILLEWVRVLKPGGFLVVLLPDKERWAKALEAGQPPNNQHRHESHVGELSTYAPALGLLVIEDRFTESPAGDYGIMFVGQKL